MYSLLRIFINILQWGQRMPVRIKGSDMEDILYISHWVKKKSEKFFDEMSLCNQDFYKVSLKSVFKCARHEQRKTSISLRFFINLCMTRNIDMVNIVILKVKHDKSSNSLADFLCNNKLELSMNLHKWFVSGETCLSIRWYDLSNTGNQLRIIRISDTHINHYDPWNKTDLCFCRPEL